MYHCGEFMLKGKCLLLQTVLIFPSANRALTLESPMQPVERTRDWSRASVIGPLIFSTNMETTAVPQWTPGAFKNQSHKEGCRSPQRARGFWESECHVPVLPPLWGLGQMALVWVCFFPSKVAKETQGCLSSPHACPHTQRLCVHVCVCMYVLWIGFGLALEFSVGTIDAALQVTHVGVEVWQMHTDNSAAGVKEIYF